MENFVRIMSGEGDEMCYYNIENQAEYQQQREEFMNKIRHGRVMYGIKGTQKQQLLNAHDMNNTSKVDQVLKDPEIITKTINLPLGAG